MVTAALVVLGLGVPAQAVEAAHWTSQRNGPRPGQHVTSLSCPTLTSCTAVTELGAALVYDGHTWGAARTADRDLSRLDSVSCPTASFCAAVGGRLATVEKHGHWGRPLVTGPELSTVTCPSATWCLAIGAGGRTWTYDGAHWRRRPAVPGLTSVVSCTSHRFCMGIASAKHHNRFLRWNGRSWSAAGSSGITRALACGSPRLCVSVSGRVALRWNGHRWTRHVFSGWDLYQRLAVDCGLHFCQLLGTHHAAEFHHRWGRVTDAAGVKDGPVSLSCAARGHCLAVTVNDARDETTATLDGSAWASTPYVEPVDVVDALSCPTATFCMGVTDDGMTRMLRDGTWTAADLPAGWTGPTQVSCTSPTFCLALVYDGSTATWDGSSWRAATGLGALGALTDCASPTYCLAVTRDAAWTWDGVSWTDAAASALAHDAPLVSVSCPGVGDCWVGNAESQVDHLIGATWSPAVTVAGPGTDDQNPVTVVCGSTSSCVAHDAFGHTFSWRGQGWRGNQKLGAIGALACGTGSSCTAAFASSGQVARWDGTTWTTARALPRGYDVSDQGAGPALACPTQRVCYLADATGNTWVRH